jgi:hypothetical protein
MAAIIKDVSGFHQGRSIDPPVVGTKETIRRLLAAYSISTMPVMPRKNQVMSVANVLHLVTVAWLPNTAPNGRDRLFELVHSMKVM